jgi:1-hydroxycarotenoid 3,4-desaturase
MIRLAQTFQTLAEKAGAKFLFNTRVINIETANSRVSAVNTEKTRHPTDAIIATADLAALDSGLLGPTAQRAVTGLSRGAKPSFSAVTWAFTGTAKNFPLAHHNVFFSPDYQAEFAQLRAGHLPTHPTVYICAPTGGPDFFALINAPANAAQAGPEALTAMLAQCTACGLRLTIDNAIQTDPAAWSQKFPATAGALYGRALTNWKDSFARSGARTKLPGLYLAGGGIHPGPGLPMAATSGRIAAQCVLTQR